MSVDKYGTAYGSGGQSQAYIYHHEDDDSTFRLVDSSRPQQRTLHHKPRGRQMQVNHFFKCWQCLNGCVTKALNECDLPLVAINCLFFVKSKIRRDREKREERKLGGRQQAPLRKNREKYNHDTV